MPQALVWELCCSRYYSRKMTAAERKYVVTEQVLELLATVEALRVVGATFW